MASSTYVYISIVIGLFSLVFYSLTCWIILANPKVFASSYYKFYILSSIVNILAYWNSALAIRLPAMVNVDSSFAPLMRNANDILLRILILGISYYGYLQYTISSLMCLNRFTAIYLPFTHNKIWQRLLIPSICITLSYPFIFDYQYLIYTGSFIQPNTSTVFAIHSEAPVTTLRSLSLFVVCFGAFIINCCLNSFVLYKIIMRKKYILTQKGGKDEHRLIIHNLCSFIGEFFVSLVTFLLIFREYPSLYSLGSFLLLYACDSVCHASPFILLLCNKEMRARVFEKISCGAHKSKKVVTVHSATSQ